MVCCLGALAAEEAGATSSELPAVEQEPAAAAEVTDEAVAAAPNVAALPALPDRNETTRTISNDHASLTISSLRGGIETFRLTGIHAIEIPEWRQTPGAEVAPEEDLPVLGPKNPLRSWDPKRPTTDLHSYVASFQLKEEQSVRHGPLEGSWQWLDSANERVLALQHQTETLRYTITYILADDAPKVMVDYRIDNLAEEAQTGRPAVYALTGIYQDDPLGEGYDLRLVTSQLGIGGEFDNETFPGPLKSESLLNYDDQKFWNINETDFVAFKSRFFAAMWQPLGMSVTQTSTTGAAGSVTAQSSDDGVDVLNALSASPAVATTTGAEGVVSYNLFGYTGKRQDPQAKLLAVFHNGQGGEITIPQNASLNTQWEISIAEMTDDSLAPLPIIEQQIKYTDWFYRFFRILVAPLAAVLGLIESIVQNYGVALIVFVVLIKGALHKLNVKQQSSMIKMQKIAPKLKDIQNRYSNDRQTMAMKQMELFKKEGVSPMGGCLPIFIQMPIFVALYQMLRHSAEMRGHSFLWVNDLTLPDQFLPLGFTLPFMSSEFTLNILPLLYMAITLWMGLSNKVPEDASDQQKMMAKVMRWIPVLFAIIFYNMPSGLVLYFTCSALIGTIEMKYIRKRLGVNGGGMPTM